MTDRSRHAGNGDALEGIDGLTTAIGNVRAHAGKVAYVE